MAKAKKSEPQPKIEDIPIEQYANIWGQDEANQIVDVLEGSSLVEGEKVKDFEKRFAKFVNAKYCVLMPNPTVALYTSLLMISPRLSNKTIRIPDFGYQEVFNACIMANLTPVLCDVNDRGTLELRDNESGIGVHYNGRESKANLIEVCFDAINKHTKGMMSIYDFNFQRHLSLGGKGGAICTDSKDEYEFLLRFKDQGRLQDDSDDFRYWGIDLQVTELQAAYGLAQLPLLDKKISSVKGFYEKIKGETESEKLLFLSETPTMYMDVYTKDPIKLGKHLVDNGVSAFRTPKPLHLQPICKYAQRMDNQFTMSNTLYQAGIFLPSSPIMSEEQIAKMVKVLKEY